MNNQCPDLHYHSGSGREFIGERPRSVQQTTRAALAAPSALRRIRLFTGEYAPNHVVTIRSQVDGWQADRRGTYRNGAWEFFFDVAGLPDTLVFKFALDGKWMLGADLIVPADVDHDFGEDQVDFPAVAAKFQHGYENFHLDYSKDAQEAAPRNTREDIPYDVIVIGSGIGGGVLADAIGR